MGASHGERNPWWLRERKLEGRPLITIATILFAA